VRHIIDVTFRKFDFFARTALRFSDSPRSVT
jgi:hypothetical protein